MTPNKRHLVLIPFWVQEVLRRQRLSLSAVLDFPSVRGVLSKEDLATFVRLGTQDHRLLGEAQSCSFSPLAAWRASIPANDHLSAQALEEIVTLQADSASLRALEERLFGPASRVARHGEPYIVCDLSPEYAGVVIFPGFFGNAEDSALQLSLTTAMLEALYVYASYSKVAQSPLFKRYLELLSS